jgi:hypothetical protein
MLQGIKQRSFYTFHIPSVQSVTLDDGSILHTKPRMNSITKELPPRVRTFPPRAKLCNEQIEQIKQLRTSDPDTNTVLQLAKKFNTFPGFIMRITQCPTARKQKLVQQAQEQFEQLSLSKKKRAIDRMRRKALW